MRIRTRLLLFLLPTILSAITVISILFSYSSYQQIVSSFEAQLKSAVLAAATLDSPSAKDLQVLQSRLKISAIEYVPLHTVQNIPTDLKVQEIQEGEDCFLTAYMPVYDVHQHVTGLISAKTNTQLIDTQFRKSLFLILLSASTAVFGLIITLFWIAQRLSRPIQKLNNSALAIAAGRYGESIAVSGPKEVQELANTLNTMSECLYENINRLKENSLLREKLYQEHECAMLLQHLMLQKNIDDSHFDTVAVRSISLFSETPKGLLLQFPKSPSPNLLYVHMSEAKQEGLEGMYQLLTKTQIPSKSFKHVKRGLWLTIDTELMQLNYQGSLFPLVWSPESWEFLGCAPNQNTSVKSGDFFFLFNQGLLFFYKNNPEKIKKFLSKILRNFAEDGLDTIHEMLQKELAFATKRTDLEEDIHLLCFQIL